MVTIDSTNQYRDAVGVDLVSHAMNRTLYHSDRQDPIVKHLYQMVGYFFEELLIWNDREIE